jgi:hypothetical protein
MMTAGRPSLSSEFGDGLPHSLGTVPQKQFYDYRDFLKIGSFDFILF